MVALTKWLALGMCLSSVACTVTLEPGPDLSDAGSGGSAGSDGGAGGDAGSSGSAGSDTGGAGMGGDLEADAGADSGSVDSMMMFATPTCEVEANDSACEQCLKQKCCDAWTGCDDELCSDQWSDIATCVTATTDLDMMSYNECVSDSVMMVIPAASTLVVLTCINEEELADAGTDDLTRCGTVCFGQDYLP